MSDKGWIKNHRKSLDNPIVCKDADHFAVWNYLLLITTHSEYDTLFGEKRITLKPGQVILGREIISKKFNISESKVQRILKMFESERMIEQITYPRKGRIITVLNWDKYQASERNSERIVNEMWTNSERNVNGKQEDKELNKINKIDKIHQEKFINTWNNNFNVKINENQFNQSINQLISSYSIDEVLSVLDKAAKSDYLLGKTETNKKGMTLNFFSKVNNFEKIKSGKYDNHDNYDVKTRKSKKTDLSSLDDRTSYEERQEFYKQKLKEPIPIKIKNK